MKAHILTMKNDSNKLLLILGHSEMIVPEALLVCNTIIEEVHVITTENNKLQELAKKIQSIFKEHFSNVFLTITAVDSINIPNSSENHAIFEEALFQWYLTKMGNSLPYVCISGGTKTMPATMQQAARFFGAADVFHIIANVPKEQNPTTFEEVMIALKEGKIEKISLGAEPGWESLKKLVPPKEFTSIHLSGINDIIYKKKKPNKIILSSSIRQIMSRLRDQYSGKQGIDLPYSNLQLLTDEQIAWLYSPLNEIEDYEWIKSLPKVDLHCHLGGFATHNNYLQKVESAAQYPDKIKPYNENSSVPKNWPLPAIPISLNDYMQLGNANGSRLLHDPGCLKMQIELLYEHFLEQNLTYAEVRCSPDNYQSPSRTAWDVLNDIQIHFETCMQKASMTNSKKFCQVNLLVIVTRKTAGDLSGISRHIALAITASRQEKKGDIHRCKVVGIDLAGYENKETRAAYYSQDFLGVHRCGLAVTAHAGENDDAEGIWQAVYHLHARRLGHALSLQDAPDLVRTVADRRIGIEMCPYANYQIKGFYPMPSELLNYPLLEYLSKGLLVTVNTDNIGISAANLTENFLLLSKLNPGIKRVQILQLIKNAIDVAFITPEERVEIISYQEQEIFNSILNHFN